MNGKKLAFIPLLIVVLLLAGCSGAAVVWPGLAQPGPAPTAPAPTAVAGVQDSSLPLSFQALQSTFEQVYTEVNPSVVNIQTAVQRSVRGSSSSVQSGLGSGFVWDQAGHIVTNNHVIEGADEITVTFADGSSTPASLVGADPYSDLAVLKVDVPASRLNPVEVADSTQVRVGQIAIAIGNPFGLQGTMTQGIVSALSRSLPVEQGLASQTGARYSIPDIIQTDAPINPGNSGGVLVDGQGRLIGVTTAIATTTQSNSGVGFVIPSAIVQKVAGSLIETGQARHSYLGITGASLTPELAEAAGLTAEQRGVAVMSVVSGGPAAQAGLRGGEGTTGDVIVAVDGQTVTRFEDLISYLYNRTEVGQRVTLTVLRQGAQRDLTVTLGELP